MSERKESLEPQNVIDLKNTFNFQNMQEFYKNMSTQSEHIAFYKHIRSGYEIVEKTQSIKSGVNEINILKKLRGNCFSKLIDYTTKPNEAILYLNKIEGYTFYGISNQPKLKEKILSHLEIVLFNSIGCLKQLHFEEILHRDVKPENLIIDEQLNVYLIDFSTAMHKKDHHLKISGVGTRGYMSPEAMFNPHDVDEYSDYYGLGRSLLELIGKDKNKVSLQVYEKIIGMCAIQKEKRKKIIDFF